MIYPPATKASKLGELLPDLADTIEKEHKRLLARKSIIEKRKEEQERLLLDMVFMSKQFSAKVTFIFQLRNYICGVQ